MSGTSHRGLPAAVALRSLPYMVPHTSRISALLLCLVAPPLLAQDHAADPETAAAITARAESERSRLGIPGMSVAVGWGGLIRYSEGFGLADLEQGVEVTSKTRFRTASIAKPMTAVAIMQLAAQGKLSLEDDILQHVPKFRPKQWEVTVKDLLCHQGGVRHYEAPGESHGTDSFLTVHESLKLFDRSKLAHQPGTKFHYTTFGYTLLGAAIINASETPYAEYMQEHIWGPAGMKSTCVDYHYEVIPHRARGYMRPNKANRAKLAIPLNKRVKNGDFLRAPLHDTSMKIPGGGLLSTSEDLVRFGMAMLQDGRLVARSVAQRMFTPVPTSTGKETRVGLGWFSIPTTFGKFVGHSGGQAGVTCMLVVNPDTGVAVAVMTNLQGVAGIRDMATGIAQLARP